MSDIVNLMTSYDLLGHCIQGSLLTYYLSYFCNINILSSDNFLCDLAINYVLGFIISRISSLVIDKFFLKVGLIKLKYYRFIDEAQKENETLKQLKVVKNFVRNITTLIIIILIIDLIMILSIKDITIYKRDIFISILLYIFMVSYSKFDYYISKKILSNITEKNKIYINRNKENKYTCPYCEKTNYLEIKGLRYNICYNCGAKYYINYNNMKINKQNKKRSFNK